jgi:hypothetical protein
MKNKKSIKKPASAGFKYTVCQLVRIFIIPVACNNFTMG